MFIGGLHIWWDWMPIVVASSSCCWLAGCTSGVRSPRSSSSLWRVDISLSRPLPSLSAIRSLFLLTTPHLGHLILVNQILNISSLHTSFLPLLGPAQLLLCLLYLHFLLIKHLIHFPKGLILEELPIDFWLGLQVLPLFMDHRRGLDAGGTWGGALVQDITSDLPRRYLRIRRGWWWCSAAIGDVL